MLMYEWDSIENEINKKFSLTKDGAYDAYLNER